MRSGPNHVHVCCVRLTHMYFCKWSGVFICACFGTFCVPRSFSSGQLRVSLRAGCTGQATGTRHCELWHALQVWGLVRSPPLVRKWHTSQVWRVGVKVEDEACTDVASLQMVFGVVSLQSLVNWGQANLRVPVCVLFCSRVCGMYHVINRVQCY